MASENTTALVQSVTQTPSPPSFEEIYRQSIGQGLTAVFAQWDAQFKSWQDKLSQAKELSQPLVPGGGNPLMTPRQRAARATASGVEHRLGWARAIYEDGRLINGNSGGWQIGLNYSGGNSFVAVQYSTPSGDPSTWPIPDNRKSDVTIYDPHLRVSLMPVAGLRPIYDATFRVRSLIKTESTTLGRTSKSWVLSCWLEDKDGIIVPVQSVYAELL